MSGFFQFLAKKINYTAAVAISTIIMLFILFMCISIPFFYLLYPNKAETLAWIMTFPLRYIFLYLALSCLIMYWIPLGLLERIKIPAFLKSFRQINKNFKNHTCNPDLTDEELRTLYNNLNKLIIKNTFFTAIIQLINLVLVLFILFKTGHDIPALISKSEFLLLILTVTIFLFILTTILTFFYTDSITKVARGECYKKLWDRKIIIKPKSYMKLSFKFNLIILFQVLNIIAFSALFKLSKYVYDVYNTVVLNVVMYNTGMISIEIFFLMSIVTSIVLIIMTYNPIQKIFKDISAVAGQIAQGKDAHFALHPLEKEFADAEFLILTMNQEIYEHRKNLENEVKERTAELQNALVNLKERDDLLQKQLDMAGSIQRGILPSKIDDWNELKFATRYFSMDKIGGDFYDVSHTIGNDIIFYVADVSGHGIPAALVTTMAKVSFGNAFSKYNSPKKIFREVNHELLDHVKTQDYLTCFMAVIDEKYNLTYANASHQKGILLRTDENKIELLDTGGLFIAAIEDAKDTYQEKTTKLNYNDRLILYTDGIPESSNAEKEHYSNERFEESILKNKDLPLKEFTNAIVDDLQAFIGGSQIQDDITLLIVELKRDETIDVIKNIRNLNGDNKYNEAIEIIQNALIEYPDNLKLLYNLAKNYFKINDFPNVIKTLNQYIKRDKENKYAYYLSGAASFKIMNYDTAIEKFQKALSIDPNFVNALFALGMTYKEKGQTAEATRSFEKLKNIDEDNRLVDYELSQLK